MPGSPGLFGSPVSPDNRIALYSARDRGYLQLFALDLRTKTTRQLTSSPDDKIIATWSPDLRWIAYVSNATGSLQLWRIPSSGGAPQQLTTGNDRVHHPFYSADGRWIYAQPNHQNIYRMPAAGGTLQPVTKFPVSGLFIEEPVISPDGRYLLYSRSTGGSSLWVLTLGNRAGDVQTSR